MAFSPLSDPAAGSIRLLLDLFLVGSPLALGVVGALRTTRAGRPRVRYGIAVLAFATAALAPVGLALSPQSDPVSPVVSSGAPPALEPTIANRSAGRALLGAWGATALRSARPIGPAVFLIWLVVAGLLVGREFTGHLQLARSRRRWSRANEETRRTLQWPSDITLVVAEGEGPSAVGILRPAVIIPRRLFEALGVGIARQVAWHELAHARWHDPAVNVAMRFLRALLWPSIPLWALEQAVRVEQEASADWAAITRAGRTPSPDVREEYASALIAVARWSEVSSDRATMALAANQTGIGSALGERVERLLRTRESSRGRQALAAVALLGGTWGALAVPPAPDLTTAEAINEAVRIDNPANAPVQIVAARLSEGRGDTGRYHPLPVFTIRNTSRVPVSRVTIGVWNNGVLDARLLYRDALAPGGRVTIDPAEGSPNVFADVVASPLLRVLAVELADGRRWTHPAAPGASPPHRE